MSDSALDKPVDIRTVRKMHQDGLLSDEVFNASLRILRPASSWLSWAEKNLLFFGSALILSGIIFFFAYNWSAMGKFFKFGLIEAGIAACVIGSFFLGLNRLTSKILLLSGSVLLGVLMAVYGQTYQTGADAFELFIGWAALIFGWVAISEFAALWLVWLILVNTGIILYWIQVVKTPNSDMPCGLFLLLAALNGSALFLRELAVRKGLKWLEGRWLRGILLAASLTALTIPSLALILDMDHNFEDIGIICLIAWIIAALCGYYCYRRLARDMVSIALITINGCIIILTLIGKLMLDNDSYHNEAFLFLAFSLIIIGVVSAAAFWLKRTAARMAKELSH